MTCVMSNSIPVPSTSQTVHEPPHEENAVSSDEGGTAAVRLKLRKPKSKKKVMWSANTVDNENMNKKKSKCCCIYEKPREFGESSSDTDDECEHCSGHKEIKKEKKKTVATGSTSQQKHQT